MYPDTLIVTTTPVPAADGVNEYGEAIEAADPVEHYTGPADGQPQTVRMNLELSGDEPLAQHDRVFVPEHEDVEAIPMKADARLTRGHTGRTHYGKVVAIDALSKSVFVRWHA